jgi:FkbM family methyltransferase
MLKIFYGYNQNLVDITNICYNKLLINDYIIIPSDDNIRANIFRDHIPGILKYIYIEDNNNNILRIDNYKIIKIHKEENNLENIEIISINDEKNRKIWWEETGKFIEDDIERLNELHKRIKFNFGNIKDEYPEQVMSMKFIKPTDKVLELGSNIGRNTCIISHLLEDSKNLVAVETDKNTCEKLDINRKNNNFNFHIENSAISKRNLVQQNNTWTTVISNNILPNYFLVNKISWEELKEKYNIDFNVLVADVEGSLYYICQDEPDFFNNFNKIIMENDYNDINHKIFVDFCLIKYGFKNIYKEAGGWGPCFNCFYEVWEK